jgi:hypothetical protein
MTRLELFPGRRAWRAQPPNRQKISSLTETVVTVGRLRFQPLTSTLNQFSSARVEKNSQVRKKLCGDNFSSF